MKASLILAAAASLLLSACASTMSGLDATSSFSCKAAPGVTCQSISGVHQNASQGNLPFQVKGDADVRTIAESKSDDDQKEKPRYGAATQESGKVSPKEMAAASSGMPVRQPPLVLRVWMAPYEDESGDLHDQSYFYTMVHSGKWMIEANRNAISSQFRPIYPLNKNVVETTSEALPREKQPLIQKGNYEGVVQKPDL